MSTSVFSCLINIPQAFCITFLCKQDQRGLVSWEQGTSGSFQLWDLQFTQSVHLQVLFFFFSLSVWEGSIGPFIHLLINSHGSRCFFWLLMLTTLEKRNWESRATSVPAALWAIRGLFLPVLYSVKHSKVMLHSCSICSCLEGKCVLLQEFF